MNCQNVIYGQRFVLECRAGGITVIVNRCHASFSPTVDAQCPVASSLSPVVQEDTVLGALRLECSF